MVVRDEFGLWRAAATDSKLYCNAEPSSFMNSKGAKNGEGGSAAGEQCATIGDGFESNGFHGGESSLR
jgi:hypothetical protein